MQGNFTVAKGAISLPTRRAPVAGQGVDESRDGPLQDSGIGAIDGTARIVQDDLEGTYNACFEANGKKNCTYKP